MVSGNCQVMKQESRFKGRDTSNSVYEVLVAFEFDLAFDFGLGDSFCTHSPWLEALACLLYSRRESTSTRSSLDKSRARSFNRRIFRCASFNYFMHVARSFISCRRCDCKELMVVPNIDSDVCFFCVDPAASEHISLSPLFVYASPYS